MHHKDNAVSSVPVLPTRNQCLHSAPYRMLGRELGLKAQGWPALHSSHSHFAHSVLGTGDARRNIGCFSQAALPAVRAVSTAHEARAEWYVSVCYSAEGARCGLSVTDLEGFLSRYDTIKLQQ